MGLDMYLEARKYVSGYGHNKPEEVAQYNALLDLAGVTPRDTGIPSATIVINVAYWRKANQIHNWFVNNVQGGEDNCKSYYVSRDQLAELRDTCVAVLDDHSKAADLLPSTSGFFFGSTDYDEWYYQELEDTVSQLDIVLNSPEYKDMDFQYDSSW